jgi:hypothetical protein
MMVAVVVVHMGDGISVREKGEQRMLPPLPSSPCHHDSCSLVASHSESLISIESNIHPSIFHSTPAIIVFEAEHYSPFSTS